MSDRYNRPIRIATRASRLALWQAEHVARLLREADPGLAVELVHVSTVGDRDQTEPLFGLGGFGVFTREVQKAVLDRRADVAVHSLKDLPTDPVDGLVLAGVPARADAFDVLVLPATAGNDVGMPSGAGPIRIGQLDELRELPLLPRGARVGTGSLRRRAQLLHCRSDLEMLDVRGNVETRVRKLDEGGYDALCLASAGLSRLGMHERICITLHPPAFFPAVGQGALGIECRADDGPTLALLSQITHAEAFAAVTAERSLLAGLRAGCHAPVGVGTAVAGRRVTLTAVVLSGDGRQRLSASASAAPDDAAELGRRVAADLHAQGAGAIIAAARM